MTKASENKDHTFMRRCFDLAVRGAGSVSPNPMVGAVLVHNDEIIGEGFHEKYGSAHAEVNAVNNVPLQKKHLIKESVLYVSLEPCCFRGKTPACTDLILEHRIPRVVISCLDSTPEVSGQGVEILRNNGVSVDVGVLEEKGQYLHRYRRIVALEQRPYVIFKYAMTQNGYFAPQNTSLWITNAFSRRLVHKWRNEIDAVLIGRRTAAVDNPQLTNRLYFGKQPLRIVIDRSLSLSPDLQIFNAAARTLVITESKPKLAYGANVQFLETAQSDYFEKTLLAHLYERYRVGILMIEGGAETIHRFMKKGIWDEAWVLVGNKYLNPPAIKAPEIPAPPDGRYEIADDQLLIFSNPNKC